MLVRKNAPPSFRKEIVVDEKHMGADETKAPQASAGISQLVTSVPSAGFDLSTPGTGLTTHSDLNYSKSEPKSSGQKQPVQHPQYARQDRNQSSKLHPIKEYEDEKSQTEHDGLQSAERRASYTQDSQQSNHTTSVNNENSKD